MNNKGNQSNPTQVPDKQILYPYYSLTWITKPHQNYIYFRDKFWTKRDIFVPINNVNGMKFLEFIKLKSPLDLDKSKQDIIELGLDDKCDDKIQLNKPYTNVLYMMSDKGRIYQDTQIRPGLLGYTTNRYRLNKILGVSSFRLFMTTSITKIAGAIILISLAQQAIQLRKRQRQLYKQLQK